MSEDLEKKLRRALCEHPHTFQNRYTEESKNNLLLTLFQALTNDNNSYLQELFPKGVPASHRLQDVQGSTEDNEYTEAARGRPCGHIFRPGEASYHCMTCTDDPTAVLCVRCFVASDHEDHQYHIASSQGTIGCCDCGDDEAWKQPVNCALHTVTDDFMSTDAEISALPQDFQTSIRVTIACVLDYFCDVIACAPENLRLPKTEDTVRQDEIISRLGAQHYGLDEPAELSPEFCLLLWNDEKHTVREVQDQVARACRERERFGLQIAEKANNNGRCIIRHSRDLPKLLRMAKIIEEIKVTVTIRSSRDTYREQMCETIIGWLADISGCEIAHDKHIIRRTVCEEMLGLWRRGSSAVNARVGRQGIQDHAKGEDQAYKDRVRAALYHDPVQIIIERAEEDAEEEGEDDQDDDDDDDDDLDLADVDEDMASVDDGYEILDTDTIVIGNGDPDATDDGDEMDTDGDNDFVDADQRFGRTQAAAPPPPPPPPPPLPPVDADTTGEPAIAANTESLSRQESEEGPDDHNRNFRNIPKTPRAPTKTTDRTPNYWTTVARQVSDQASPVPLHENLRKNIRVDSMILFDLRLWKEVRTSIRNLLISTVVNIPQFKRVLGLRFAGLYTTLAQLHLVADREPDHSIISLSLQLLTTPSITEEVVDKAEFLTVLIAILYTFLTTRQVGFPSDVDPDAILGFDAGSVTNRRLYHFFHDLTFCLNSPFAQSRIRSDKRFLFQFLDLAKLSQGICPNVRALGEHVEYETDAWISASLLTREINKLCRQFAAAFEKDSARISNLNHPTCQVIFEAARVAIANSVGLETQRFEHSEIRDVVKFHSFGYHAAERELFYKVVDFTVEKGSLSFHHPLHYTLSWLLEHGTASKMAIVALQNAASELVASLQNVRVHGAHLQAIYSEGEDALLALFDYPLRVCAWLAQMRPNLWVRNGHSLRHQMDQYKNVANRDLGHHRDLFMLQTALVSCNPGRVLASMIDRFGLRTLLVGKCEPLPECDASQMVDVVEEFVYLVINLLSDRDSLMARGEGESSNLVTLRKDIAHTLCFKPLSFSILNARLSERAQAHNQFQEVLEAMTNYRAPEGLNDTGVFELKEEFLEELDPYNSYFSKNQRDEAENIYKAWKAKKTRKAPDEIVLEPKLHPIESEAFQDLCAVVNEPLFANIVHALLNYAMTATSRHASVSATRIEAFLSVLLQLVLIAALEDKALENEDLHNEQHSFVKNALGWQIGYEDGQRRTIAHLLHKIWTLDDFSACRSKVKHILRLFNQKQPALFLNVAKVIDTPVARFDSASPAQVESDAEAKKKQALARKAKIMAQMQQQQQSFMDKQGVVNWGDDDMSDQEAQLPASTERRMWKAPSGVCIQCREETNDSRLYGTFAMVSDAHVLRETPINCVDFLREALTTPSDLDRSLDSKRPFGVASANHEQVKRLKSNGSELVVDRQGLGKGWPDGWTLKGPVSTSCGHIMHFACFENYYQSVIRRHTHQIARNHPERTQLKEFVCPLCKALANVFLPIVFRGTEQSYPGPLKTSMSFDIFLDYSLKSALQTHNVPKCTDKDIESTYHVQTAKGFSTQAMLPLVQLLEKTETNTGNLAARWIELQDQPGAVAFAELSSAYGRLRESLAIAEKAQLPQITGSEGINRPEQLKMLLDTLANSVAATEIACRGKASTYGSSLLDSISSSTLSHLQVLSFSFQAYAATSALSLGSAFSEQYRAAFTGVLRRLLQDDTKDLAGTRGPTSALEMDAFTLFVQAANTICRAKEYPLHHMLRLCLTLELMRVAAALIYSDGSAQGSCETALNQVELSVPTLSVNDNAERMSISNMLTFFKQQMYYGTLSDTPHDPIQVAQVSTALRSYALVFMRKAAIYLHVGCGLDLPMTTGTEAAASELERLTRFLKLPSIFALIAELPAHSGRFSLHKLASGWIEDSVFYDVGPEQNARKSLRPIRLLHPAPLELIGLPKYFDVLIEESQKRRCPTTGRELTDPALCLFCGAIFCTQAVCCMSDWHQGGGNRHLLKCSFPIGLFLLIRKCQVVMLHVARDPQKIESENPIRERGDAGRSGNKIISHGSFHAAPYLTKHGEPDSGLRTKHQLILNQKRYDKLLRDTWLMVNSSVWSTVARKLEGDINAGGWETL